MLTYSADGEPRNVADFSKLSLAEAGMPSLKTLRHCFLDERRQTTPAPLLDCVAHLLLYLDEPETLLQIGLTFLANQLRVSRADAGMCQPSDLLFTPTAIYFYPHDLVTVER